MDVVPFAEAARFLPQVDAVDHAPHCDRAVVIPTYFSGNESLRLKGEKGVLLKEVDQLEISDGTANFSAALAKAYELLNAPAGQKQILLITDMALTGWDHFSVSSLKHYDPSITVKVIRIGRKEQPLNGTIKEIRLGGHGVGVDLPIDLEVVVANFGVAGLISRKLQFHSHVGFAVGSIGVAGGGAVVIFYLLAALALMLYLR